MAESLISSEHHYRWATREQGILNLGMQRIDVRCSALESISTQATLVAGFAFGSLQPDVLDSLIPTDEDEPKSFLVGMMWQAFAMVFIVCSSVSFAASIWVIYMALYVGYKAQFSALQGKDGIAVSTSLQILLRTNERISHWFNISLASLAVGAALMAFVHLPLSSFLALLCTFIFFIYDGATFQTNLDQSFNAIGDPAEEGIADAAPLTGESDVTTSSKQGPTSTSTRGGKAGGVVAAMASARTKGYQELRGRDRDELPASHTGYQVTKQGWLYKSPSRKGPDGTGPKAMPQDKRYFVLRDHELKWYGTEDEATLERSAKNAVDLRLYVVHALTDTDCVLALESISPLAKKSWYLRARDQHEFEEWQRVLTAATGNSNSPRVW